VNTTALKMAQQRYLLQPLLWLRLLLLASVCRTASCAVYGPPSPLLVNAFVGGNESWFRFPEASSGSNYSMPCVTSRPRFGIALSGGGMRAATAGLGFLRGLHTVSCYRYRPYTAYRHAAVQQVTPPASVSTCACLQGQPGRLAAAACKRLHQQPMQMQLLPKQLLLIY
jgi:hypothetical protein